LATLIFKFHSSDKCFIQLTAFCNPVDVLAHPVKSFIISNPATCLFLITKGWMLAFSYQFKVSLINTSNSTSDSEHPLLIQHLIKIPPIPNYFWGFRNTHYK
jgi:hypothetical protein